MARGQRSRDRPSRRPDGRTAHRAEARDAGRAHPGGAEGADVPHRVPWRGRCRRNARPRARRRARGGESSRLGGSVSDRRGTRDRRRRGPRPRARIDRCGVSRARRARGERCVSAVLAPRSVQRRVLAARVRRAARGLRIDVGPRVPARGAGRRAGGERARGPVGAAARRSERVDHGALRTALGAPRASRHRAGCGGRRRARGAGAVRGHRSRRGCAAAAEECVPLAHDSRRDGGRVRSGPRYRDGGRGGFAELHATARVRRGRRRSRARSTHPRAALLGLCIGRAGDRHGLRVVWCRAAR